MLDPETQIDYPLMQSTVLSGYFGDPDEDGEFAKGFMRVCDLTQYSIHLGHVLDYLGRPWGCKIYCNWIMIKPLQRAFQFIIDRGFAELLETYDGCFNIRRSRGGGITSMHSWGLAVDFNAASNAFGAVPQMSSGLVQCFTDAGLEWGGLWSTPDGMHFQLPLIKYPRPGGPNYDNGLPWLV